MPKSNKCEYHEVHFLLAYNKKDQSGLRKYTLWKKMSGIHFSREKIRGFKGKIPQEF